MNRVIKRTSELSISDVPPSDADWDEVSEFALSFDPILELGTTDVYKIEYFHYDETATLLNLRLSLFLRQRAWNWLSREIDQEGLDDVSKILKLIRQKF